MKKRIKNTYLYFTAQLIEDAIYGTWDNCSETNGDIRGGIMYGGVIYKNQAYFIGDNSENRLHTIQNFIHRFSFVKSPYFENLEYKRSSYSYFGSYNTNYLFY